jgi:hypothetical protein
MRRASAGGPTSTRHMYRSSLAPVTQKQSPIKNCMLASSFTDFGAGARRDKVILQYVETQGL